MTGSILVVDDVATNRIVFRVKLSAACYEVLQASCGREALEIARRERPDLILLDLAMPEMDGIEVCRRLRADPRTAEIPVVIITAQRGPRARIEALAAGADDFFSKPVDDAILLARLRSLLRARSATAELALRESTSHALGFAEPAPDPMAFAPAGRIALLARKSEEVLAWRDALAARMPNRVELQAPLSALREGGEAPVADVYVLRETMQRTGDGLQLMAELRARPATRYSAVVVVVDPEARNQAAMALDLGASDLLMLPFEPEEAVLRLRTQLRRKAEADRLRQRLRDGLQMAVVDPLTDLYNRRYALSHLDRVHTRAVERRRSYALMVLDLDRFKAVNDTHGHAAGDEVLRAVADRLRGTLRNVDLVARFGGEEFLVVMPDIGRDAATRAADRLRRRVSDLPIALPSGERIAQTVSIGLAMGGGETGGAASADAVLAQADRALYVAKSEGRNRAHEDRRDQSAA